MEITVQLDKKLYKRIPAGKYFASDLLIYSLGDLGSLGLFMPGIPNTGKNDLACGPGLLRVLHFLRGRGFRDFCI